MAHYWLVGGDDTSDSPPAPMVQLPIAARRRIGASPPVRRGDPPGSPARGRPSCRIATRREAHAAVWQLCGRKPRTPGGSPDPLPYHAARPHLRSRRAALCFNAAAFSGAWYRSTCAKDGGSLYALELLRRLSEANGIPGYEERIRGAIVVPETGSPLRRGLRLDALGNVIGIKRGRGRRAHGAR